LYKEYRVSYATVANMGLTSHGKHVGSNKYQTSQKMIAFHKGSLKKYSRCNAWQWVYAPRGEENSRLDSSHEGSYLI